MNTSSKATEKWKREHTQRIVFYLNKDTEQDVLKHLMNQPNKRTYLVGLIKQDMERR